MDLDTLIFVVLCLHIPRFILWICAALSPHKNLSTHSQSTKRLVCGGGTLLYRMLYILTSISHRFLYYDTSVSAATDVVVSTEVIHYLSVIFTRQHMFGAALVYFQSIWRSVCTCNTMYILYYARLNFSQVQFIEQCNWCGSVNRNGQVICIQDICIYKNLRCNISLPFVFANTHFVKNLSTHSQSTWRCVMGERVGLFHNFHNVLHLISHRSNYISVNAATDIMVSTEMDKQSIAIYTRVWYNISVFLLATTHLELYKNLSTYSQSIWRSVCRHFVYRIYIYTFNFSQVIIRLVSVRQLMWWCQQKWTSDLTFSYLTLAIKCTHGHLSLYHIHTIFILKNYSVIKNTKVLNPRRKLLSSSI